MNPLNVYTIGLAIFLIVALMPMLSDEMLLCIQQYLPYGYDKFLIYIILFFGIFWPILIIPYIVVMASSLYISYAVKFLSKEELDNLLIDAPDYLIDAIELRENYFKK
jgi:hypothetical protein